MIDYQIHDVSEKKLKLGFWLLKHKQLFLKLGLATLILWCFLTVGYSLYSFISYALELPKDNQQLAQLAVSFIDFNSFRQKHQPQPLIISSPQIIFYGADNYDFIAEVSNPNEQRGVVELSYYFRSADFLTPTSTITILPKQTVYLLSLGNQSAKRLTQAELVILRIAWQSLWQKQPVGEIALTVSDSKFHSPVSPVLERQAANVSKRSWVSFTAVNNSLKNIWEVDWQVVLFSGSRLVAANQMFSERFLAGETRNIEVSWYERLPKITQINIVPLINVYDDNNFFELPGEVREGNY